MLHLGSTPFLRRLASELEGVVEQAILIEDLGYESFWLPEGHFADEGGMPAPLLVQAAVAARTETLVLGTTSLLLPLRQPLLLAEEIAVLDRLSGGRLILGLGRGFRRATFEVLGIDPKAKRLIFERNLEVIRRAWRGEPLAGDTPLELSPRPLQNPHPPLWVAAFGPLALAQVGRLALPYLASPIESEEQLATNHTLHRRAFLELSEGDPAHDSPPMIPGLAVPIMRTVFASHEQRLLEQARLALEAEMKARPGPRRSPVDEWAIVGSPDQVAARLAGLEERLGMTHCIVRPGVRGVGRDAIRRSLELIREVVSR